MLGVSQPFLKIQFNDTVDIEKIEIAFKDIKLDPFCDGSYRYRALNRYHIHENRLIEASKFPLFQSDRVNKLWGNMSREFEELNFSGESLLELEKLVLLFLSYCSVDLDKIEVGVHPIRTVTANNTEGHPAPEGIHSDGYLFTSIFVIRRDKSIEGATTSLYCDANGKECIFNEILAEGEGVVIDDKVLFHYTSPIKPLDGITITRDILAITVSPKDSDPTISGAYSR